MMVNNKVSVRCNKQTPTPYLRANCHNMLDPALVISKAVVVDLGCGNGRNSKYVCNTLGVPHNLYALDIRTDYGDKCDIGNECLPVPDATAHIILAQYSLMWFTVGELDHVLAEITRIAARYCRLMIEIYAAKSSYVPDKASAQARLMYCVQALIDSHAWYPIHWTGDRAILRTNL